MSRYEIERDMCFMICEPALEPEFQLYDMLPDGSRRFLIRPAPIYRPPAPGNADPAEGE